MFLPEIQPMGQGAPCTTSTWMSKSHPAPLSGDPNLVIHVSLENKPTIENSHSASIFKQRTELLEIGELDIYPKKTMEGIWVIDFCQEIQIRNKISTLYLNKTSQSIMIFLA